MRDGIDVSEYQHPNGAPIDYAAVRASGVDWVCVKVNEAMGGVGPHFVADVVGFRGVGCETLLYHFARPTSTDAAAAGAHFADLCDMTDRTLERVLDLEDGEALGWDALTDWAVRCCAAAGVTVLYLNRYYLTHLHLAAFPPDLRLWVAWPGQLTVPFGLYAVQYGQQGVAGIVGDVDVNHVADAPAPAPPSPPGGLDPMAVSLQYRGQLHSFHVDDQGTVVHHWHDGNAWSVDYPITNALPRSQPTIQQGWGGNADRLDLFTETKVGIAHAWCWPDQAWQSEVL